MNEKTASHEQQPSDLKTLFYLTYRFTQGQPNTFRKLISWVYANKYITKEQVTADPPSDILAIKPPSAHVKVELDNDERWRDLVLESHFPLSEQELQALEIDILETMIRRDLDYQVHERPGRQVETVNMDSLADKHSSLVRKFVLQKQYPGHPAYVKLFHDKLHPVLLEWIPSLGYSYAKNLSYMQNLEKLQESWEKNHHGQKFFQPVQNAA